jgi:hypothetical protein
MNYPYLIFFENNTLYFARMNNNIEDIDNFLQLSDRIATAGHDKRHE